MKYGKMYDEKTLDKPPLGLLVEWLLTLTSSLLSFIEW